MGFIFKVNQPLFFFAVNADRHNNAACVNLIRLFLIFQLSFFFQSAHGHQGKIHQADKLVLSPCENLTVIFQIFFISVLDRFPVISFIKNYILQFCRKSRVTTVIGPVSIQHSDLGHCRISVFLSEKVFLDMKKILKRHRQAK